MKRKILFGALALSLVLVAASCNKNNSAPDSMEQGDSMKTDNTDSNDTMNKPADSMDQPSDSMTDDKGGDKMDSANDQGSMSNGADKMAPAGDAMSK